MSEDKFIMPNRDEVTIYENTSGRTGRLAENFKIINDCEPVAIVGYLVEPQPKPVSEAIDWLLAHASDARWDIVAKYMNIMYIAGLRKQISEDGFRL